MKNFENFSDSSNRFQRLEEVNSLFPPFITFRSYDKNEGFDVSWHQCNINFLKNISIEKLIQTLNIYKEFTNPFLINILNWWINSDESILVIITESTFTTTIDQIGKNQFNKHRPKALSKWFHCIIQCLNFFHNIKPNPIFHGNFNVNLLFIKSLTGNIRLMNPLFFHKLFLPFQINLNVNPFTPPEAFFDSISSKSDIWIFGLVLLYSSTGILPYLECNSIALMIQKIIRFEIPEIINLIEDNDLKDLILLCLKSPDLRPSSDILQNHFFFKKF